MSLAIEIDLGFEDYTRAHYKVFDTVQISQIVKQLCKIAKSDVSPNIDIFS